MGGGVEEEVGEVKGRRNLPVMYGGEIEGRENRE